MNWQKHNQDIADAYRIRKAWLERKKNSQSGGSGSSSSWNGLLGIIAILIVVSLAIAITTPSPTNPGTVKQVNSRALTVRTSPGADKPEVKTGSPLSLGTRVKLLGKSVVVSDGGIWVLISTKDVEGWVNQKYLK